MADSKGNDNNRYDEIADTFQRVFDSSKGIEAACNTLNDSLGDIKDRVSNLVNKLNAGEIKETTFANKVIKILNDHLKLQYDLKGSEKTASFNSEVADKLRIALEQFPNILDSKVVDKLLTGLSNIYNTKIVKSNEDEATGKDPVFKGTLDNEKLKGILDEAHKKRGLQVQGFQGWLISTLLGPVSKQNQKQQKGLVDYLIDGLANNKFIGGAMRDTVRLFGLLGASWLSQHFGKLGRVLGGILYGLSETLSGVVTQAIIQGIAQGISLALGQKLIDAILKLGPKTMGGITTGSTVAVASLLAGVAGIAAGVDSWKEGRKGLGATLGISGAGTAIAGTAVGTGLAAQGLLLGGVGAGSTGATALLTALAGLINPITAAVLGISAAVLGLSLFWKFFGDDISKYFKKLFGIKDREQREKEAKATNIFGELKGGGGSIGGTSWTTPNGSGGVTYHGSPAGVVHNVKSGGVKSSKGVRTFGKLRVNPDGSLANLNQLTKMEASRDLQAYQKADPESFNRLFEWVGGDIASLGSFETDAAIRDKHGNAIKALVYKGATRDVLEMRKRLVAGGMSQKQANQFKISSGAATASNKYHAQGGAHDDPYARTVDFIGSGWDTGTYNRYGSSVISPFLRGIGRGYLLHGEGGGMTGLHIHSTGPSAKPKGAKENEEIFWKNQKAKSEQQSIKPKEEAPKEEKKAEEKTKPEVKAEVPVTTSPDKSQQGSTPILNNIIKTASGGIDITGNMTFSKVQQTLGTIALSGPDQIRP